jgi:hypothetical protein
MKEFCLRSKRKMSQRSRQRGRFFGNIPIASRATLATLLLSLLASTANADTECFIGNENDWQTVISGADGKLSNDYLLGIDGLFVTMQIRFFPSGKVCGLGGFMDSGNIRFEGENFSDGQLRFNFLPFPAEKEDVSHDIENVAAAKRERHQRERAKALFSRHLSGTVTKQVAGDLIIWDGRVRGSDGKEIEVYFKRTRPTAKQPPASNNFACGTDGQCNPLSFSVAIKKGHKDTFLREAKQLPISKIDEIKPGQDFKGCSDNPEVLELNAGETCFEGEAWPFEENNVVSALNRKSYVRSARRTGGEAGDDGETHYLQSDLLLSNNLRLNLPVAEPLFNDAIRKYFGETGLSISDSSFMKNSLFWELKGQRFQFEKKSNPSPSDKSEWWKVRLQVAVTELNGGTYALTIGMPTTRVAFWALSTVPDDEKFTTELDNDDRFLDLQGRLLVAITKFVPMGIP